MKNKHIFIVSVIAIGILPSCARVKSYKKRAIPSLHSYINYEQTCDNVHMHVKKLDRDDCIRFFGSRGSRLVHHKHSTSIYPIQLSLYNDTDKTFTLQEKDVDLKLSQYRHVARRIQNNTTLRALGIIAAGAGVALLIAASGAVAFTAGLISWSIPLTVAGAAACASVPFMVLVHVPVDMAVQSIQSFRTNSYIKRDMKDKSLMRAVVIEPGTTVDTIIFVKGINYKPEFDLKLRNQDDPNDTIAFAIDLEQKNKIDMPGDESSNALIELVEQADA